ncbi:winged helix-turn-helix domain-containing protein [Streptomyces sp. NBC_00257]|uniref:BTAD domain-containing putative transcriptional regulator n=1 Tax=unclassified Streptomyces TaxID=2593676 RepID=UPI00225A80EB|nr:MULTISPECIES: BTAD domain-containing putative transcriptional regulator [unclassified Streptomyces]WTB59638.1 winged helix-turn-helix domain-containing protein [Streptomyces sp. NBC_00826]WTH95777.1 winged helix-turn-helix domain-containing protein [Streptomyces sp. NBC_00825]WTI04502.1 winged helix-turn-helix domain-containing protein [Streptomyces sp. NBC_00822]MCX4867481.1 winged helix-turn-helix domain-containing protein [Streptomyces sp. NBC_00906]MCX4898719.1 winged helix-turn-helix d
MRYCILGTTRALRDDGTAVTIGGARLRALLTVLALRPGRTVPATVLVDEVWDGEPPADAVGALQALVGRLRRAVGHDAIVSVDSGYRLAAEPDAVDLHRFERLAGDGARALEEGDPVKARTVLDDALVLWRGPVLADLPDRLTEAARWEARRLDARRNRLRAVLALGRPDEALPELVALCAEHPIDEPLQALRLRALRDAGRTAQALAAYDEVRTGLADRLGTDPGPELRALHAELLRQDLPAPAAPSASPRPSAAAAPYGNLRARLTSFVGREDDIATLGQDLSHARLVTLLGPGGAGKTRLSQETAESVADAWPDGVWLAELAPVDDPESVPEAVLTALGARETVLRGAGAEELRVAEGNVNDPLARLTEHCSRRRMLLLLDNCEHVIDAAAALTDHLLAHCPYLTVLATSREPLGVPGEFVRPVEPLPDPMALRLLADRGAAARPGFRTDADEETAAAAAEICRRLDGLPLAIELAAARLRMLTPRQIADRLDDRFRLLTSGARTVLPRQQTLRAVVDWSWDLLDEAERAVLRRLSVFAGGCTLDAAEAVCADGPRGAREVAGLLGSLVDKSLVVAAPAEDGEMRYRLLETVGEYAAARLDEAAEREPVVRRHLVFYRELVRTVEPELRGAGQRSAIALLEREYENIRTALRHAVAARDEQEVLCMVLSLCWYWQMRELRTDALHWAEAAAALGPDPFAPPVGAAAVEPAPSIHERCTDAPPPMGPELLGEARRQVALVQLVSTDHSQNIWADEEGMARLRVIASTYRAGQPQTCRVPASLWFFAVVLTGETTDLPLLLDETVRACREYGYEWELAEALQMRANVLANRPEWAGEARTDADESLRIFSRIGDDWGAAESLSSRGEANERRGEYALAAEDFQAAIGYARKLGAQSQVAVLRTRHASVLTELGRGTEGEQILREVLAEGRRAGHGAVPFARLHLVMWLGRSGRTGEAREQLAALREDFQSDTRAVFEGVVLGATAWLDNQEGLYEQALPRGLMALERSTDRLSQMMAPQMSVIHLVAIARSLAGIGGEQRATVAARLLGAGRGLLPEGHVRTAMELDDWARAEELAVAVLGRAGYEAAYAEGGGLSLEEAAALADAYRG